MTESRTRFDQRIAALGPDILAPEFDDGALPAPAARGRPDAPDRRRAARPAHDRRHRQPVEGRGLLRRPGSTRGGRPGEVSDEEALRDRRAPCRPRMQESARDGIQTRYRRIYGTRRPPVPALRRRAIRSRGQGDDNRTTYWCPGCQRDAAPRRPQGRRPHRARQHARVVRRGARARRRHDRVRRPARGPRAPGDRRLLLAHDYEHVRAGRARRSRRASSTSPARAFAARARRRPQAARLRGARRRGAARARAASSARSSRRCTCAAWSRCASSSRGCGSAGRSRACGATTPPRAARSCPPTALLVTCAARLPAVARRARARRPLRRADGALAARHAAARARAARGGRRALRLDRRRRGADPPRSRRSA